MAVTSPLLTTKSRLGADGRRVARARTIDVMPTVVACDTDVVCGMFQYRDRRAAPGTTFADVRAALGAVGARRVPHLLRSLRARVPLPARPDAFYVVEFAVDASRRGHGLGTAMLGEIERTAIATGARELALDTQLDNPARRLYARAGFVAVAEVPMPAYERLTGVPGRVVLAKAL